MQIKKPGVADNKSYKDMYHFKDNFFSKDNAPSLNVDPKINDSIKENPYKSNVEIEGGEVVIKPDFTALFRAVGKKHKGGGMDVHLQENSFIFSDDKTLAITDKEKEMMEFKMGGKYKAINNTPAEIVKKNVDPKHYNTLINNISDIDKDDLAKKSSTRMLEKYLGTLGNIAFLQEQKKGFPDGLPDISMGTAPVFKDELKEEIMQQKQYLRKGGRVMQPGGQLRISDQTVTPQGAPVLLEYFKNDPSRAEDIKKLQAFINASNPFSFTHNSNYYQGKMPSPTQNQVNPAFSFADNANYYANANKPVAMNPYNFQRTPTSSPATSQNEAPHYSGIPAKPKDPYSGVPPIIPGRMPTDVIEKYRPPAPVGGVKIPGLPAAPPEPLVPGDVTGGDGVKRADWEFTPWQKLSQGYGALKYATAKRYMPMRSHLNSSTVDPALVNPEQVIGDIKGNFNAQVNAAGSALSPILRNAQASSAYGELLDKIPGVRSQYDNQNVGIKNQAAQYNNQIANNQRAVNMQNDQQYYRESVIGQQNFDNMRTYLADQTMNNVLRDVETNQTLAYNLLTQNNPVYDFDWRTGNFTRTKKDIRDVQGGEANDNIQEMVKMLRDPSIDGPTKQALAKLFGSKLLSSNATSQNLFKKKGGMFRPK